MERRRFDDDLELRVRFLEGNIKELTNTIASLNLRVQELTASNNELSTYLRTGKIGVEIIKWTVGVGSALTLMWAALKGVK